jgi:predicted unusual protein kinase regulating ubiquinone biosynthesis (AarF/ABC1/UbiB family)
MRLLVILYRLLPLALAFWRDHRRWLLFGPPVPRTPADHQRRAERLVQQLAALGPTFVKMAQLFAGRADILSPVYARALTTLTDRVPSVPVEEVERILTSEYGAPPESVFERFDRIPLAAASLGQVHRAVYAGEEVVVKVLRPGVEALVAEDVRAARRIIAVVERWWPNPHVIGTRVVIDEFALRVAEEMDFRLEAAHAVAIGANFAGSPAIWIPRVVEPMVRQRALVLEYCPGRRIDRLDEWVAEGRVEPDRIVREVMELYARMMLVHGLFHADPHPGNMHVAADGRIILLDFGMVVRVPLELRRQLVAAIFAAIRRDPDALAESFHALGLVVTGADPAVIRRLAATLLTVASQRITTRERVELLADDVLAELFDWPIVLPSHLVYFARTASLIEGLGTHYDTRFNALHFATPIALSMRRSILGSLYPDGGGPGVDPARVIGAAIGAVARIIYRAGGEMAAAVRDAVAQATLPEAEAMLRNPHVGPTVGPPQDVVATTALARSTSSRRRRL